MFTIACRLVIGLGLGLGLGLDLVSGWLTALAETWTDVWGGRSRRVSAEKFFCRPPQNVTFGGRRGTHCVREFRYLTH